MTIETKTVVYKKVNDAELVIRIYFPKNNNAGLKKPAVLFFFGGGWSGGTIEQFAPQSIFLASQNFVCCTPEYRVASRHHTTPFASVEDAKDAVYWVWQHSTQLGIDAARIAVSGGSAGAHLAACTAMLQSNEFDVGQIYKIPGAMVLFNPVCDTSENGFGRKLIGERSLEISPFHHIEENLPPTLIFHGTDDSIVPFASTAAFCARMKEFGNDCTLIAYPGRSHGFFNKPAGQDNEDYTDTLNRMHDFLKNKFL